MNHQLQILKRLVCRMVSVITICLIWFTINPLKSNGQTTVTIYASGAGTSSSGSVNSGGTKNLDAMTNISNSNRGWAHFDLSSIPSNAQIISVTANFTLYNVSCLTCSQTGTLYGFNGDPATIPGATLYTNAASGPVLETSSWGTSNATLSKNFNTNGINYIQSNIGTNNANVGYTKASGGLINAYNIRGYNYTTSTQRPNLVISYVTPCSGIPDPGATNSTVIGICGATSTTLSLQNDVSAIGITYQWQSGPSSSGPWTNFGSGGATQVTTVSVPTYFQCAVNCSGSGTGFSDPIFLDAIIPNPGNTLTNISSVCGGSSVNLSLQNATSGSGISYKWQTGASSNGPWTDFGGTSATQTATVVSTSWYRCGVTCPGGTTSFSNPVIVNSITPNPGNTLAGSTQVCIGSNVSLSLQNATPGSGVTYQWQSGPTNTGPWSNFGTSVASLSASVSGSTWYRCIVSCSAGGATGTSNPVFVDGPNCINMPNSGSITTCNALFYDSGGPSGNYADNESKVYTFNPQAGNRIKITFSSFNTESGYDKMTIYDGPNTLSPVILNGHSGTSNPGSFTSSTGPLTIVFFSDGATNSAGWVASVTCLANPPCSGTPNPGNTVASTTTTCSGSSLNLSLQNVIAAVGITFNWQTGPTSTGPWTNFGANAAIITINPTTTAYYRCEVNCSIGGTAQSNPVQVSISACMKNGSTTTCGGNFFDSGGPIGDYSNSESYTFTIYPQTGNYLRVTFNSFNTESGYDYFYIYNGPTTAYPVLVNGASGSGGVSGTYTSTDFATGALTFVFTSDGAVTAAGWNATLSCVPIPVCTVPVPGNTLASQTTLCEGTSTNLSIQNNPAELGYTYQWQSAPASSGPWTDISGATLKTLTRAVPVSIWFRCMVICNLTTSVPSNPIFIDAVPCYNMPSGTGNNTYSTCNTYFYDNGGPFANYSNVSATRVTTFQPTTPGNVIRIRWDSFVSNTAHPITIFDGPDINSPILFGPSTGTLSIPTLTASNPAGLLTVRFVTTTQASRAGWAAYIDCVPACTGIPNPGNSLVTNAAPCYNGSVTMSLQNNISNDGGISLQWQTGPSASGPWTNVSGAVYATYTKNITAPAWYQCIATCSFSGMSSNSTPVFVDMACLNMQNGTITGCGFNFYDSGGPSGNYGKNDRTITFLPSVPGQVIQIVFNSFTSLPIDLLYIYNGPSTSDPVLVNGIGGNMGGSLTIFSTHPTGALTVRFDGDNSNLITSTLAGWDAYVSCQTPGKDLVCIPSYNNITGNQPCLNSGCSDDDLISNFTINGMSFPSACSCGGFSYTPSPTIPVAPGSSYPFNVRLGINGSAPVMGVKIWVDWNDDGKFDEVTELVNSSGVPVNGSYSGSFEVPGCATPGDHRLRLRTVYNVMNFTACSRHGFGEAEDYVITVQSVSAVPPVMTSITGPSSGICNQPLNFVLASGYAGNVTWQYSTTSSSGPFYSFPFNTNFANINLDASSLGQGTFYFRAKVTGVGCNPTNSLFSNVLTTALGPPQISISVSSPSNNVCRGVPVTLSAIGAGPYRWSTGESTANIVVTPHVNTTYTLVTGSGTCTASANTSFSVSGPVAQAQSSAALICPGSSVNLGAYVYGTQSNVMNPVTGGGSISIASTLVLATNGSPFPSILNVSGFTNGIYSVESVSINGMSHSRWSDVDMILRDPYGRSVILMADVGGNNSYSNRNFVITDAASQSFTTGNPTSGTYKPTNLGSWDGANLSPYYSTFAALGTYPTVNGTWRLYVYDDSGALGANGGSITSWSITFKGGIPVPYTTNGPTTYAWTGPGGFTSNSLNTIATPPSAGSYTLTIADNTCSSSSNVVIGFHPQPSVTASNVSEVCANNDISLSASGSGINSPTNQAGQLTIDISAPGFIDEVSWNVKNSSGNIIATANYAGFLGHSITATVNPSYSDYPLTFFIETEGDFNDNNDVDVVVTCGLSGDVLISTLMNGGETYEELINCSLPASYLSYVWNGPQGLFYDQEFTINGATVADAGTYTVVMTDGNGCTASSSTDVIIYPNPELFTQSITPVACLGQNNGAFSIRVTPGTGSPQFTYSGSGPSTITPNTSGNFTNRLAGTYTMFVSDKNGCVSESPWQVVVPTAPNQPPSIVCPNDIVKNTDSGVCGAVVTYAAPVGTDACPGAVTTRTSGLASGSLFPLGTTTITHLVTDAQGLTASCSFTVTVEDHEAPNAICKPKTVQLDANGNGSIVVADVDNGSNDACGIASRSISKSTFNCSNVGSNTVVLTITDNNGNTSTCNAIVTVEDHVAPVANCKPVTIYLDASGNASTSATDVDNNSADACGIYSRVLSKTTFDCSNVGNNSVVLTVTDNNGNSSTCNTMVTVIDAINPVISCPAPIVKNNDPGICGAVVTYTVGASDNCPGYTLTRTAGLASGSTFPVGTTVNSFILTDFSGNTATCSFSVTINDVEYPSITNVPANFSKCNPVTWTPPTISDNCPGVQVTSSHVPNTNFPSGTTTVTYTATDVYGHTSTASFNVTLLEPSVAANAITSNRDFNNICRGESITLTVDGGVLGEGANWTWYAGGCGAGTAVGFGSSIIVSPTTTTTYYARAEGQCNITGCVSIQVVVSTGAPSTAVVYSYLPAYGAPGVTDSIKVVPVPGATFYRWFTNNGHVNSVLFNGVISPVETTQPKVDVTFVLPEQNYQIRVLAGNACGRTAQSNIHIRGTEEAPTSLSGPTLVCPTDTGTYTVSAVTPVSGNTPVTYNWQLNPSGAGTIVGTGLTRKVIFSPTFTTAQLCVNAISSFGLPGPALCIVISSNAPTPGAISGKALPCSGSTEIYSISSVTGATGYNWTCNIAGSNVVVFNNGLSASVTFPAGAFTGQVCVSANSTCGVSSPSCFNVASGAPGTPSSITGPVLGVCNATGHYSVSAPGAASYNWLLPAGVTLGGANNSNSVDLTFGSPFSSGTITVQVGYDCGSNSSSLFVNGKPEVPVVSPATICAGTMDLYFASSSANTQYYTWQLTGNNDAYCTNPPLCSQQFVEWGSTGGTMSVTATNACGTSAPFNLSTNCRISDAGSLETKVFPNPTTGRVTVTFNGASDTRFEISLTDMSGRLMLTDDVKAHAGTNAVDLDLSFVSKGLYMLYVKDHQGKVSVTRVAVE